MLRTAEPSEPAKKLAARCALRGEAPAKFLGTARVKHIIERCFQLADMTKDQAARAMEYADATTVSKWLAGIESPSIVRIWAVPVLRVALLEALAEDAADDVIVEKCFRIRRKTA